MCHRELQFTPKMEFGEGMGPTDPKTTQPRSQPGLSFLFGRGQTQRAAAERPPHRAGSGGDAARGRHGAGLL